nr:immunoglobulin heavy chain junction region [Mus musculus]
CANYDEAMDYW